MSIESYVRFISVFLILLYIFIILTRGFTLHAFIIALTLIAIAIPAVIKNWYNIGDTINLVAWIINGSIVYQNRETWK